MFMNRSEWHIYCNMNQSFIKHFFCRYRLSWSSKYFLYCIRFIVGLGSIQQHLHKATGPIK